ncbi:DUF1998 domain-containing protein [Mycobacterium sp. SMC-13]|uniref:DUF1998 domain-containing protein n=1 Tax=Mycobacterium sp. SMC-13 TaxID=3381626 RepID=UPI003876714E
MKMQTVFTRRRERISSDEEERRRAGFELHTSYRFSQHGPRTGRLDATVASAEGPTPLAALSYGDTATVRVTNVGRRRRKHPGDLGYWLDTVKGEWLSEREAGDTTPQEDELEDAADAPSKQKVIPYVEDTRNILVFRLTRPVTEEAATSLRYALERGVEAEFQLEDSELSSEALPDNDSRARMLFTESAEGGAGVLRRLHSEPEALAQAARKALDIAHFRPDGSDAGQADGARERCEKACYDCLLSYGNQTDHQNIDRHAVRDLLMELAAATTSPTAASSPAGERIDQIHTQAESQLERDFIELLVEHDFALPDGVREPIGSTTLTADFVYRSDDAALAVFLDEQTPVDAGQVEDTLIDIGWSVLRLKVGEDWVNKIRQHAYAFGEGR